MRSSSADSRSEKTLVPPARVPRVLQLRHFAIGVGSFLIGVGGLVSGVAAAPPGAYALPPRVLLDVSFMTQAPTGSWAQPYQDACEEATILMAHHWAEGTTVTRREANEELLEMIALERRMFGGFKDTSAAKTVELSEAFSDDRTARLVPTATLTEVKQELAVGNIVILPMAGRRLKGPYYTPPGPLYHMLLLRGYDDATAEFVVNDAGTNTKGEAFRFSYTAIERSWNDWDDARHTLAHPGSAKPMIVVSRNK